MEYYLAVDIGATSGRHILGHIENGRLIIEEIFRFETHSAKQGENWVWNCDDLSEKTLEGIALCKTLGKIPRSVAIDAWGADYVLLDKNGNTLGSASDYRDDMSCFEMLYASENFISYPEYYERTGIGKMPIDTVYQLMVLQKEHPEVLDQAETLLMIPSFLNYRLTGIIKQEYSNAVTTGLVNAKTRNWDEELIKRFGLPRVIFTELFESGERVGHFSEDVRNRVGFDCEVILTTSHDTTAAFIAVPSEEKSSVTVSSGTWSILGTINDNPVLKAAAMEAGLSNESAYPRKYRLSKNIMGMFVLNKISEALNGKYTYTQLVDMARQAKKIDSVMNMEDLTYLMADDMITAIKEDCAASGQEVPQTEGEVVQVFFKSLIGYYVKTVRELEAVCEKRFESFNIIGGGSANDYLCAMAAEALGLPVISGPVEATTLGNIMCQLLAFKELPDLASAKRLCAESFKIKRFN